MDYTYSQQLKSKMTAMSRYRDSRIITDMDSKFKFLETYQKQDIPLSNQDYYHTVTPEEELRLDLISYRYYQTPLLWWVIASVNDINDTFIAPSVGDVLRVPTITTLYGRGGILL